MKASLGALVLLLALALFLSMADTATYFGVTDAGFIWTLTLIVWVPSLVASLVTLFRLGVRTRGGRISNAVGTTYLGFFLSVIIASTFHMLAMRIDHWLLFPAAATHTLANIEAPISDAYATHGRNAADYIRLPPLPSSIKVSGKDYGMLAADALHRDKQTDPDSFRVAGRYCARITLQTAGASARILDAGDSALRSGSVHPCPAHYIDYFAHLDGIAAIPD